VYRTVFTTMEQTAPLKENKVTVPIVAHGGERAHDRVREMVSLVAQNVVGGTVPDCGHFQPKERPDEIARQTLKLVKPAQPSHADRTSFPADDGLRPFGLVNPGRLEECSIQQTTREVRDERV
jgi:hypothetical protein